MNDSTTSDGAGEGSGARNTWEDIVAAARRLDASAFEKRTFEPVLAVKLAQAVLAFHKQMERGQIPFPPVPPSL